MATLRSSPVINVLVIAHPDDESMFFVPLLFSLTSNTWIICLTTGDYDGLGATRRVELETAVRLLPKAMMIQLRQLHRPDQFPDHPRQKWDITAVAAALEETLRDIIIVSSTSSSSANSTKNADDDEPPQRLRLFTFDADGVSGHWNHRDTYFAVRHVVQRATNHNSNSNSSTTTTTSRLPIESAWCLRTVHNPIRKYFPVFEWLRLLLSRLVGDVSSWEGQLQGNDDSREKVVAADDAEDDGDELVYRLLRPAQNWQLMRTHWSQFVWYRRLFVIFSCYTYCNRFRRISVVTKA
jgi:N-acetylglucosaminylphosphatidylinositol deacetylase